MKTNSLLTTVFWLSVALTVCMSWAAVDSMNEGALMWAFICGAVGLIAYRIEKEGES